VSVSPSSAAAVAGAVAHALLERLEHGQLVVGAAARPATRQPRPHDPDGVAARADTTTQHVSHVSVGVRPVRARCFQTLSVRVLVPPPSIRTNSRGIEPASALSSLSQASDSYVVVALRSRWRQTLVSRGLYGREGVSALRRYQYAPTASVGLPCAVVGREPT
jgi:hypothetical protein